MKQRFFTWWEELPARWQVMAATPVLFVAIFLVHVAFFPLVEWYQALMYAAMEAVPAALIVTFATQVELARRRQVAEQPAAENDEDPFDIGELP